MIAREKEHGEVLGSYRRTVLIRVIPKGIIRVIPKGTVLTSKFLFPWMTISEVYSAEKLMALGSFLKMIT